MESIASPITWGDRGNEFARLAATGNLEALRNAHKELATGMAMAQAYSAIQNALPPALQLRALRVFREELAKQGL